MSTENIIVFGAGAAGANTLINLIHSHPTLNYAVVDFDSVELRNVTAGTQPYTKSDIGRPKVQAIQRILSVTRDKKISGFPCRINSAKDIENIALSPSTTLLIDAFDNVNSRNLFLDIDSRYNVLHVGFSANLDGEAVWNESYSKMTESKADAKIDVCQLHLARPFIMAISAIAAIVAADFIDDNVKKSVYFDSSIKTMVFS
jgi:hypothetical protein